MPDWKIFDSVPFGFSTKQVLIVLGLVVLVSGTAVGATVATLSFTPVSGATGTLGTADLQVDSSSLQYSGVDVTQVDVVVRNTDDSAAHNGEVTVTVNTADGSTPTSETVDLNADSTTTITVDITDTSMDNFNGVDVRIEQTG